MRVLIDDMISRWTEFKDLFLFGELMPPPFRKPSTRNDAKVFRKLFRMAKRQPSLQFWKDMASHEVSIKGKSGTELSLEVPPGMDSMYGNDSSDEENDDNIADEDDQDELESEASPAKVQATSNSFSASRSVKLRFPGETAPFFIPFMSRPSSNKQDLQNAAESAFSSALGQNRLLLFAKQTRERGKGKVKVEDLGDGASKPSIFDQNLRWSIEHIFQDGDDADELLRIFWEILQVHGQPEFVQIQSWLRSTEFAPHLVQVKNPTPISTIHGDSSGLESGEIGDILQTHREYQLANVQNSEDLRKQILSLGRLYRQARIYNLTKLIDLIRHKLQAAWNYYPGLGQLEPILEVTKMAFKDMPESCKHDNLQKWLIRFLADTQDLFTYDCGSKWWALMGELSDLYSEVSQVRTEMHRGHPERYADLLFLLRSRGIEEIG